LLKDEVSPPSTLFPTAVREVIQRNYNRFEWARSWVDLAGAEKTLTEWGDAKTLWLLVPSQDVGRAMGSAPWYPPCPACGRNASYRAVDPLRSWQVECVHCKARFPANDFDAFFESGRDGQGIFQRELADPNLLVARSDAPIPAVDDGTGWVDSKGQRYFFVPVACRERWVRLIGFLHQWARAFVITDDIRFARATLSLLFRIAQVYPSMDFAPYAKLGAFESYGHSGLGRIFGRIGETGVAMVCAEAYDAVKPALNDPLLLASLSQLAKRPITPTNLRETIEVGLLREMLSSFQEQPPRIRGNIGHTHLAYAMVSLALNDFDALLWLDDAKWDENLSRVFAELVDRDGVGSECSPGYNLGWAASFWLLMEMLTRVDRDPLRFSERFGSVVKRMLKAPFRLLVAGVTPNIGDHGECGKPQKSLLSAEIYASAFAQFGDKDLASMAFWANGGEWKGLHPTITYPDPESLLSQMKEQEPSNPTPTNSFLRDGYGLVALTNPSPRSLSERVWVWLYFGRNAHFGHGHRDQLNFGMFWRGMDILPDIGYPIWTIEHPFSDHFIRNTISHNTVVIDRKPQGKSWSGRCLGFAETPIASFAWVEANKAYFPHRVERLLVLMPHDEGAYLLDILWVHGGNEHLLSFHTAPAQVNGEFRELKSVPDPFEGATEESGLTFLRWRGEGPSTETPFVAQFQMSQGITVQVHCLTDAQRFLAEATVTKRNEEKVLPYLIQRRQSDSSVFVTIIEPFVEKPFCREATLCSALSLDGSLSGRPVAVQVKLRDGGTDWIFADPEGNRLWQWGEGWKVRGRLAVVRERPNNSAALLWHGDVLVTTQHSLSLPSSAVTGRVKDFSRGWEDAWLLVGGLSTPVLSASISKFVRVETESERDAAFVWQKLEQTRDGLLLHLGDTHFIVGGREGEWRYLLTKGAPVIMPTLAVNCEAG
jgi:hypothetical protein